MVDGICARLHEQNRRWRTVASVIGATIEILASKIRGQLLLPGNPGYEAERKVWNGSFDGYPAALVRCADAEDVIDY
ncbi:hypothetical protein H6F61_22715 [Cyanobacteria bacterium FACHB-472]|nr:hypothetical protein [Cyanobacteria bacterium FACHB-472]